MVLHSYDLNHGVHLFNGTRYSLVVWLTDSEASCRAGVSPWYLSAAEAGSVDAQDALAELYQMGQHGYPRDVQQAVLWATRAAEQGQASAQSRLGRLLLAGEGVSRDPVAGIRWVQLAAEQGYPSAEYTMGVSCQYGDTPGGDEEAARWFLKAAESGVAAAQYEIGLAYVNGDGVERDRVAGNLWLGQAAAQGNVEAVEALEQLDQLLKAEEEYRAQHGAGVGAAVTVETEAPEAMEDAEVLQAQADAESA